MKGGIKNQTTPVELQANSSITLEAVNDNKPIVIQLTLPTEQLNALQRQSAPPPPIITPRGMPRTIAAAYIGCSPRKFDSMVNAGEMPQPRLIGTKKVWDRIDLDDYFEALPKADEDGNDWDDC